MSLGDWLSDPEWDRPIYKKLAHNDTGAARGHQGGLVVPKDLRDFFPGLNPKVTQAQPTVDHHIRADLVVGDNTVSRVTTRYQYQTWGGTRSPESRLTDNLGTLRNVAQAGDYVIFQRSMNDLDLYRLILVKQGTPDFEWMVATQNVQRWGVLTDEIPLRESDLEDSRTKQHVRESGAFEPFDQEAMLVTRKTIQIARSLAFREILLELYDGVCATCQKGLRSGRLFEVEGAHIIPRHKNGADDARNGITLCRTHHWAFDKGLFGVDSDYHIIVPPKTLRAKANKPLGDFDGVKLKTPIKTELAPADEALEWHRQNVLSG